MGSCGLLIKEKVSWQMSSHFGLWLALRQIIVSTYQTRHQLDTQNTMKITLQRYQKYSTENYFSSTLVIWSEWSDNNSRWWLCVCPHEADDAASGAEWDSGHTYMNVSRRSTTSTWLKCLAQSRAVLQQRQDKNNSVHTRLLCYYERLMTKTNSLLVQSNQASLSTLFAALGNVYIQIFSIQQLEGFVGHVKTETACDCGWGTLENSA